MEWKSERYITVSCLKYWLKTKTNNNKKEYLAEHLYILRLMPARIVMVELIL